MDDYDDLRDDMPPPDVVGDDRPSDNEDALNDLNDQFQDPKPAADAPADDSDDESLLSEVDEAQFADFDPSAVQVAPDFETLKGIKVNKRQRSEGDGGTKKKKEKTRERVRQNRRQDSDEGFSGGEEIDGKRARRAGDGQKKIRARVEPDDADLTPEERRRRALDRAMDLAVKKGNSNRRKRDGGIDLESMADQEIEEMRTRMTRAAEEDGEDVRLGKPASKKLAMLPEVVALLNRNNYTQAILDPETNLLEAVRFFLEPLTDGSLPAYNIQRELFAALAKLPMTKEALISSGIGKVILFYRKSKRPEPAIKRQATKLMEEWSRPLLQRSDDFTKKQWETMVFDPSRVVNRPAQPMIPRKNAGAMAPGTKVSERAALARGVTNYTIAPQSMARR